VHDGVEGRAFVLCAEEKAIEERPIGQIADDQFDAARQQIAPTVAQVVKNYGFMSTVRQQSRDRSSNVPCTAGNQDLHKISLPNREPIWFSLCLLKQTGEPGQFRPSSQ
jgi:hypothetical protein